MNPCPAPAKDIKCVMFRSQQSFLGQTQSLECKILGRDVPNMKYQAINLPTKPEKFKISGCNPDKLAIMVETVHACLGDSLQEMDIVKHQWPAGSQGPGSVGL
eukprot:6527396-Ditylum_brightwellii.AAC.1